MSYGGGGGGGGLGCHKQRILSQTGDPGSRVAREKRNPKTAFQDKAFAYVYLRIDRRQNCFPNTYTQKQNLQIAPQRHHGY